ncbi:MAG: hypothetical protein NC548_49670 [Lachnospiraceae bacterium]|nr:hypothetical protein [Lachnospiraceae bacterium]
MKRVILSSEDAIFSMSNLRGMHVVTEPEGLDFSFYYSSKAEVNHGIRVKPIFNPTKMKRELAGVLELHSGWMYTPGREDTKVSYSRVWRMKDFFRKYKVLFSAVWEEQLSEDAVYLFFTGKYTLHDVITELDCYEDNSYILDSVLDVKTLEKVVRKYNLFNMND